MLHKVMLVQLSVIIILNIEFDDSRGNYVKINVPYSTHTLILFLCLCGGTVTVSAALNLRVWRRTGLINPEIVSLHCC